MPQRHLGRAVEDHGVRIVMVMSSRHPVVISGLVIFVIVGAALLAGNPAPNSVEGAVPGWLVLVWKAQLALGATTALGAVLMHRRTPGEVILSLGIERAAWVWFGSATLMYPIVLFGTGQPPALTTIGYAASYGIGPLVWAWMLGRSLRRLRDLQ